MNTDPGHVVAQFVAAFKSRDAERLAPFLHPDVEFEAYGDTPIRGRDAVLATWAGIFGNFEQVEFSTVHTAVNGEVVIEEQIHGLGLPGRSLAPIRNMAIYRVHDGLIREWRDYTNPQFAATLL